MQVGRSTFAVLAISDRGLRRNFERILAWCVVSGLLALAGGLFHGDARLALWAGAVAIDAMGGAVGFYTPWLGRSRTADWTIEGGHFAERCQGFILIAIGESIVVIGATLAARLAGPISLTGSEIGAFVISVVGSIAFWWLYFDRSARDAALLGGPALFLAGHAAFKAVVLHRISWQRVGAIPVLALLGLLVPRVSAVTLSACSVAVVVAVVVADQLWPPPTANSLAPSTRN
jgi:low temperature requirement protein LtrA